MTDNTNEHIEEQMEERRKVNAHTRAVLDANPHSNILFNDKFQVVDCNPAALKLVGFETKEELISGFIERITKGIPEYQSTGLRSVPLPERFMTVMKEGFVRFETNIVLQGQEMTLDVEFKKIPYGDTFAIVAYVFDMTKLHQREMELKRARELNELQLTKVNMVVKATKIGLWDLEVINDDPADEGNIYTWSPEFRTMLGYTDENDFPNQLSSWSERLHPDDKDAAYDAFARHISDKTGRTPYDIEYRLLKKNGEYAYIRDSCESIRDENGNAIRIAGALMDITETKNLLLETEKQRMAAEAANKAKSNFLSAMSHEIRTPMNAILGITEIQLQNELLDKDVHEALGKIHTSGDMLLGIINDILDLSKIESGKLELFIDKYEIASLISDAAQLNMMRIGSKPVEFELQIDETVPATLKGDELRVKQILNNILSNAFKYTASGTVKLSIATEPAPENDNDNTILILSITDTGQGMTKDQVEKLFDEYSRFNTEANRTTEGTGLGMSITQNLIMLMNGNIAVESEPGKGSTFTVHLPQGKVGTEILGAEMVKNLQQFRTSSRSQMKRVQISREPMPYGKVLIVDDVETNIYVAKGLMTPYELKIDAADSGPAAIEILKAGAEYDVVFMDHMMPLMDGLEATKIIRGMGYALPIVALTANAVSGQAEMFLANGFDDFISKPIDVRQLNSVLNKLVRDRHPPEDVEAARERKTIKEELHADETQSQSVNARFAEIFTRDARKSIGILDSFMENSGSLSEEDIRMYTIHIHGMKGALANIGKNDLSGAASKLETQVRNGEIEAIIAETPAFLASLKALVEELTPEAETEDTLTTDEDRAYLREKLQETKAACEIYDKKAAKALISALREKTWAHPIKEMLDEIAEDLLHSGFDEIVETLDKFSETQGI